MTTLVPEMIRRSIDPLAPLLSRAQEALTEEEARSFFEACELLTVQVQALRDVLKRELSRGITADRLRALTGAVADTARAVLWSVGEIRSRRDDVPDYPERDEGLKMVDRLHDLVEATHVEASDSLLRLDAIRPLRPAPGLLDRLQAQGPESFTRFDVPQTGQEKAS